MNKFIEINEIGRYSTREKDKKGNTVYHTVIEGKILINTEQIRCVSISGFDWEDVDNHIIKEGSQRYCVYFDQDRSVYTDRESYDKIKKFVLPIDKDNNNELD